MSVESQTPDTKTLKGKRGPSHTSGVVKEGRGKRIVAWKEGCRSFSASLRGPRAFGTNSSAEKGREEEGNRPRKGWGV